MAGVCASWWLLAVSPLPATPHACTYLSAPSLMQCTGDFSPSPDLYNVSSSVKSLSRVRLFAIPQTVPCQVPLSMGFSRQEHWSGLPFPSSEDISDPGIKPGSPALQADSLLLELQGRHTMLTAPQDPLPRRSPSGTWGFPVLHLLCL